MRKTSLYSGLQGVALIQSWDSSRSWGLEGGLARERVVERHGISILRLGSGFVGLWVGWINAWH